MEEKKNLTIEDVNVVYLYPATKYLTHKEYDSRWDKDNYIILKRDKKTYKVGFFTTLNNIDKIKVFPAKEGTKDFNVIWKYLGKKKKIGEEEDLIEQKRFIP
jgi:hypothetical protein